MKFEVNIQPMPGVLIDIILIFFFLDRVSIIYFLKVRAYVHFYQYYLNYNQFNVLRAATISKYTVINY